MLKPARLTLIILSIMCFYSCKKGGTDAPEVPEFLANLKLVSPNYTPDNNEYVNGVTINPQNDAPPHDDITDYGYYVSTNNGTQQKVSLGRTPPNTFLFTIHNMLPSTLYVIKAYVRYGGEDYFAPVLSFTTYPGTWKKLTNFNLSGEDLTATSHSPTGFAANGKGYVMFSNGHLYQYTVGNDSWTSKNPFNLTYTGRQEIPRVFFTINNIAYLYFRGGIWKYNDAADSWANILQQAEPVTGYGSAFVINNKAYILQCVEYGLYLTSKVYDPVANTMENISMTSTRIEANGFATNNFIYILSSRPYDFGSGTVYPAFTYNPANDTYIKKDNGFEVGPFANRPGAVSFTINGKAYMGEGSTGQINDEYYVYSEQGPEYQQVNRQFPAIFDSRNAGGRYNGTAFVINGKAYVGFGDYGRTDLWEFTP
jgi:hypothetical protein